MKSKLAKNIKINTEVIKSLNPCKDRFNNWLKHYNNKTFSILKFLELKDITAQDKIWVAVRVLPGNILETFAVDCAFSANQYAAAAYADAAAAYAAAAYADAAAYAAAYAAADAAADAERANQVEALICLIEHEDKL